MKAPVSGNVEEARRAYAMRAWSDAYERFALADQTAPLAIDDLELKAWSAILCGRDDDYLKAGERIYHAYLDIGHHTHAARWAFWLCFRLFALEEFGRATGWHARAERLIEPLGDDCVEAGYLLLPAVFRDIGASNFEAARANAFKAIAIGERFDDADLLATARTLQGRVLMKSGQIGEGVALVDEAMLSAASGELSPVVTGFIYCIVIASCRQAFQLDRAREWTLALTEWCDAQPQLVAFSGACLAHRSEVLQLNGDWEEALTQARGACKRVPRGRDREANAAGYYQQAEIHRLRGAFDAAESDYQKASELGREPQPGLALLRLAQGRADDAASAMRRALAATTDRTQRTALLPASVEVMLAAGDIEGAGAAARELEDIARDFDAEIVAAMATHARGAVELASGNAATALPLLRRAIAAWQQVAAPYLVARLRALVGLACRALGDEEGATLEFKAARAIFAELGAEPDVARIDSLAGVLQGGASSGLSTRELQVLRMVAAGTTNRNIAAELFISEKTVDRHVSNIFGKLDVSSRAAATAYAYKHGLA